MTSKQPLPEEYTDWYIYFMGRRFITDQRALIPRLETEELIKYCLKFLEKNPQIQTIADIWTGSGIIPLSLAYKTDEPLTIFASDLSQDALDLANENFVKMKDERICKKENSVKTPFLKGDVTEWQGDLWGVNKPLVSNFTEIPYRWDLTAKARDLRKNMTWPEKKIWYMVFKKNSLKKLRFLRQKPLLDYIVDFYCHSLGLVIELDGFSHHKNEEYDKKRTVELEKYWLTVVRFSNDEVLYGLDDVCLRLEKIVDSLQNKSSVSCDSWRINPPSSHSSDTSFKKEVETIRFLKWDLLNPLIHALKHDIPAEILITANLPYVREIEINEGLAHEPRMAFLGGVETGFELYERFFDQLFSWKNRPRKCHVVIEFWLWQRDIAETVFMSKNCSYTFFADLRGIERFAHICL